MGKTEKGAVWLDPEKTSPYEFYQYWRNVADADVKRCLSLLTFIPMDEINAMTNVEGAAINKAKERLAFEVTKIVHGEEEAIKADQAAKALFVGGVHAGSIPSTEMSANDFAEGMDILTLLQQLKLVPSRSEGRRLVTQNGVKVNEKPFTDLNQMITTADFNNNELMIQKGKKVFHKVVLV